MTERSTVRWTLRRRLVAVVVGLFVVVAAGMAAVSTLALRGSLVGQLDETVMASSARALRAEDRPRTSDQPETLAEELDEHEPPPGLDVPGQGAGTVTLSVDEGTVRAAYIDAEGEFRQLTDAQTATLRDVEADGRPRTVGLEDLGEYRVVARTTTGGDLVVTGLSTREVTATVSRYLVVELLVAAAGIVVAAVAGLALVRRELRPLDRVAATATRVSELPLHEGEVALAERVPAVDTDPATEVGQVGAALNRLLGHVEDALAVRHSSETQVRQFVADASHELRTPLASIRGYAELVRRLPADLPPDALRAMERVESESLRMTGLVEDMLLLARLDAGRPLEHEDVDLVALAVDAVSDAHAAGPDHVWQLDLPGADDAQVAPVTDGDEPVTLADDVDVDALEDLLTDDDAPHAMVRGDEHRLRQVLVNLLANARVHTPVGTTVRTAVREQDGSVVLTVTDDGPGIAPELRSTLFQRFSRGDAARSPGSGSSGLGLAIVEAVVRAHGGRIEVDGTPGATTFTVTLPRSGTTELPRSGTAELPRSGEAALPPSGTAELPR